MNKHLSMSKLRAGLSNILASPKDDGEIKAIVIRTDKSHRADVDTCQISLARGMHGDHWEKGCWKSTDSGMPHPDVQICMMNSRCISLIAQERYNWAIAGDNLFIDMDLTPKNLPAGTRLKIGTAIIEITDTPHTGCAKFIERYGYDACVFVNTGDGKKYNLRGIYGRVVQDGALNVGDLMKKIV